MESCEGCQNYYKSAFDEPCFSCIRRHHGTHIGADDLYRRGEIGSMSFCLNCKYSSMSARDYPCNCCSRLCKGVINNWESKNEEEKIIMVQCHNCKYYEKANTDVPCNTCLNAGNGGCSNWQKKEEEEEQPEVKSNFVKGEEFNLLKLKNGFEILVGHKKISVFKYGEPYVDYSADTDLLITTLIEEIGGKLND